MKYAANPVIVDAYLIKEVGDLTTEGDVLLCFENGGSQHATKEMLSRMMPKVGDYLVIQEDGYEYLNPRDVFHRKYTPFIPK